MTWTYSGDPSTNEVDKYRFLIGDTNESEPVLQDGEIQFVINEHKNHNVRLYHLYEAAATFFARKIGRKVGPIEEKTYTRQLYYVSKVAYYRSLISGSNISSPISTKSVFSKGMHDNGRY